MGGKDDDDRRFDLKKWIDTERAEMERVRRDLFDELDKSFPGSFHESHSASSASGKSPSERFKSFIDSSLGTLSDGFRNFPSNISELKARMQSEWEARREEERDIWRRWTGSEDSPDHIRMQIERSSKQDRQAERDAAQMLLREAFEHHKHTPVKKIVDLYRDNEVTFGGLDQFAAPMLSFGGACYYKPETVENLPSTARWGWPAPKQRWLTVEWFKRDPYSPIRLEAHPDLQASGAKWRAAFEDLICASLDRPMVSEEKVGQKVPYGKPQSTFYGPGLDWMLSLQCRGILPPQLPSLYRECADSNLPVSISEWESEFKKVLELPTACSRRSRIGNLVKEDSKLLSDEIAIKSGPTTEAAPLPIPQSPWRVPETEEELYEQMPPTTAVLPPLPEGSYVPEMTGHWEEDTDEAQDALLEAVMANDLQTAVKCLNAYYKVYGDVSELLHERYMGFEDSRWCSVIKEALEHSDVPSQPVHPSEIAQTKSYDDPRGQSMADMLAQQYDSQKPSILSQLTTTETTRLPDGTVTTKVVLKQRFADGREETRESVQTTHEPPASQPVQTNPLEKKPETKGWFWS